MAHAPVTALVLTRNEERAIAKCLESLRFCDQVLVIDSNSTDATASIVEDCGAELILFDWNGRYPKKKQWAMELESIRNEWVLHLDADEIVTEDLAREITSVLAFTPDDVAAYEIPLTYVFMGRRLRHGHRVKKRALVKRSRARFPEVGDLLAPGISEVEGHYQPDVQGKCRPSRSRILHHDPDPVETWIARHNRYSSWEAYLAESPELRTAVRRSRSKAGRLFDRVPAKPLFFFLYSYILRLGFLDGRPGLYYALQLSWYYSTVSMKRYEMRLATNAEPGLSHE